MPKMLIVKRTKGCNCPDVIVHFDRFAEPEDISIGQKYDDGDWDSCRHGSEVCEATPADLTWAFVAACEEDGRAEKARERLARFHKPGHDNPIPAWACAGAIRYVLDDLGVSGLVEEPIQVETGQETASEEGKPL